MTLKFQEKKKEKKTRFFHYTPVHNKRSQWHPNLSIKFFSSLRIFWYTVKTIFIYAKHFCGRIHYSNQASLFWNQNETMHRKKCDMVSIGLFIHMCMHACTCVCVLYKMQISMYVFYSSILFKQYFMTFCEKKLNLH